MKVFTFCSLVLSNQSRQLVKDSAIFEFELLSCNTGAGGGGSAVVLACRLHQEETGSAPGRWTLHQCQTIKKIVFAPPAETVHHQVQMLMMMENSLGARIYTKAAFTILLCHHISPNFPLSILVLLKRKVKLLLLCPSTNSSQKLLLCHCWSSVENLSYSSGTSCLATFEFYLLNLLIFCDSVLFEVFPSCACRSPVQGLLKPFCLTFGVNIWLWQPLLLPWQSVSWIHDVHRVS